jgi:hypothetical protein
MNSMNLVVGGFVGFDEPKEPHELKKPKELNESGVSL